MFFSPETVEEVRTGNDLVDLVSSYLPLKQKGGKYFGLCPFHNEKSASFSVDPAAQLFYCFGCGEAGNSISFAMKMENYDFVDAVKFLADRIHYELPQENNSEDMKRSAELKEQLYEINRVAARYFYDELQKGGPAAEYLDKRRVSGKIRTRFGLGYAPAKRVLREFLLDKGFNDEDIQKSGLVIADKKGGFFDRFANRLMFPIFNAQGKIVGFGGRIIGEGEPKYLNSPDTPVFDKSKNLYGINQARLSKSRMIIVVEGYMDVLSLHQAGFTNSVAALGTAFNAGHVGLLKKYADAVTLLMDSDQAGINATLRAIPFLTEGGIKTKVLHVTDAKDPDEYIVKFGNESFSNLLSKAMPHVTFQIRCIREKCDLSLVDERVRFIMEVSALLAKLPGAVEREAYAGEVSRLTGISMDSIITEIGKISDKSLDGVKAVKKPSLLSATKDRAMEKGVVEAQKEILWLAAEDLHVYEVLRANLQPQEMCDPDYRMLLEYIYKLHSQNKTWYAAEALNNFAEPEAQRKLAEIFAGGRRFIEEDDSRTLEEIVNGALRRIKRHNIDEQVNVAKAEGRLNELQMLGAQRRKLGELSIKL